MAQSKSKDSLNKRLPIVEDYPSALTQEIVHRVHVTDTTPHLVWTNQMQFVLLELLPDGNLIIFTRNNDVIKVTPEQYSVPNFDFYNFLVDEYTTMVETPKTVPNTDLNPRSEMGLNHPDQFNPMDIIEEFTFTAHKLAYAKPPKQIIRTVAPVPIPEQNADKLIFWNFELPNKEFYDCWYHTSNRWLPNYPTMYYSLYKQCDIHLAEHDGAFPTGPVPIRLPTPHICGINTHLVDQESQETLFLRGCPTYEPDMHVPKLVTPAQLPMKSCNIFFTYVNEGFHSEYFEDEIHSFMLDVITVRQRCWNLQHYRCRLDHDNKLSRFWLDHPIRDRVIWLMHRPEPASSEYHIAQVKECQEGTQLITREPCDMVEELGASFIESVYTTNPDNATHFDLVDIPKVKFTLLDNMDARNRGFVHYYEFNQYILYQNVQAINLYTFGNRQNNVYIDLFHDGSKVEFAWRRFRHVVRTTLRNERYDLRPVLQLVENTRGPVEYVPNTDIVVRKPVRPLPFRILNWTPVIIPCKSKQCKTPPTTYSHLPRDPNTPGNPVAGYKRALTVRNSLFNQMIKHRTPHYCGFTKKHWVVGREGPLTFLVCGNWLDENLKVDFNQMTDKPPEVDPEMTFTTFSPREGPCGFTSSMVRLHPRDSPETSKTPPEFVPLPTWSCGVGCTPPAELESIRVHSSPEMQRWLLHLCLNAHKLKYMENENLFIPCSINKHATWREVSSAGYRAFFCSNFAFLGLNYHLPLGHPMRWAVAYQFSDSELEALPWFYQGGKAQTAKLGDIKVKRPYKGAPKYSVTRRSDGKTCYYSLKRFGIGEPLLHHMEEHPIIYDDPYEADTNLVSKFLELKRRSWIEQDRLKYLTSSIFSLPSPQQQMLNRAILYHCLGNTTDLQSDEFEQSSNRLADQLATAFDSMSFGPAPMAPLLAAIAPSKSSSKSQATDSDQPPPVPSREKKPPRSTFKNFFQSK